jgi:anti-sigma factor RsiW
MRCSLCEGALDAFVEGALPDETRTGVAAHVDDCDRCRALLEELRCIDALLLMPRQVEPQSNFTLKVMADIRSVPTPVIARTPAHHVVITYLAFAWTIIGAWLVFGGGSAREALSWGASTLVGYGGGFGALAGATTQLFGSETSGVSALMGIIIAVDFVAAAGLAIAYVVRAPRLAERLTRISENL